jgi:hypothetical protein
MGFNSGFKWLKYTIISQHHIYCQLCLLERNVSTQPGHQQAILEPYFKVYEVAVHILVANQVGQGPFTSLHSLYKYFPIMHSYHYFPVV